MKKYIALVLILLGLVARTYSAPSAGLVITNNLFEPDGVAFAWSNSLYLTYTDSNIVQGVVALYTDTQTDPLTNVVSGFMAPAGLVYVPARDTLFVGDTRLRQVFQIARNGTISNIWGFPFTAGTRDGTNSSSGGVVTPGDPPANTNQTGKALFTSPAALAADKAGNVFVADVDSGTIRKISTDNGVTNVATGFYKPSGLALDDAGRIYVADTMNHSIQMIDLDGKVKLVAGTGKSQDAGYRNGPTTNGSATARALFNKPRGLLWVDATVGLLICDTGNHVVRQLLNGVVSTYVVLTNAAPYDTPRAAPYNIARDEDGNYRVTDVLNNALWTVQVTTPQPPVRAPIIGNVYETNNIYGTTTTFIEAVIDSTYNNDIEAEGKVVNIDNDSGTTAFYRIGPIADRVPVPGPTDSSTDFSVGKTLPRSIIPTDRPVGYNVVTIKAIGMAAGRKSSPMVTATYRFVVGNPTIVGNNPGAFTIDTGTTKGARFYYTVDGTDPVEYLSRAYVTNKPLNVVNGTNDIDFRIQGFKSGFRASPVVQKTMLFKDLQTGSIGVLNTNIQAGIGATIVVPVQVKLPSGMQLRSLQFRVEVTPDGTNNAAILDQFRALPIDPLNDFITVNAPRAEADKDVQPVYSQYLNSTTNNGVIKPVRGLTISYIGTNANFLVTDFATVAMLAVPMPATVGQGASYTIGIRAPSGTADGEQFDVPLVTLSDQHITIANIPYLAGDSAVAEGYNAGEFGGLKNHGTNLVNLANSDVNNAFNASMGVRTPFYFSDVFDAMDTFPEDSEVGVGGDGQIRYLDWQIILKRALRWDPNDTFNWMRVWGPDGRRVSSSTNITGLADSPARRSKLDHQGQVWYRQALIGATPLENVSPGATVRVPVHIAAQAEPYVAGVQLRAAVEPVGSAPRITAAVQFVKADALPDPIQIAGLQETLPADQTAVAWSLLQNQLPQALMKKYTLGHVQVTIPFNAQPGQQYRVRFLNADGAPDLKTQYDFETLPSRIWVGTPAQAPQGILTDEWKQHFFGSLDNPWSAPDADPDGDGVPNALEYQKGTNPVKLRLQATLADGVAAGSRGLTLRWFAVLGGTYVVESTPDLAHWTAVQANVAGDGEVHEYAAPAGLACHLFYRLRSK